MKKKNFMKCLALMFAVGLTSLALVGCMPAKVKISLGSYNATTNTFTSNGAQSEYTLDVQGNTLFIKGEIPYSESVLGIDAGNIVALRFVLEENLTSDETTSIKTTNNKDESANGWNVYGKSALETDGSLIWVTAVSKTKDVQIKIKWNKDYEETTYTLKIATDATLSPAPTPAA